MAIDFAKLAAEVKKQREAQQVAAPMVASQTSVIAPASSVPPLVPAVTAAVPVGKGVDVTLGDLGMSNESAPSGAAIEYPGLVDLVTKINSLDAAITAKHPSMDSLLQSIHRNLLADPELVHILKPEQVAVLFRGLQQKTQTHIVTETVMSASSGIGRGLKNIGLEDM